MAPRYAGHPIARYRPYGPLWLPDDHAHYILIDDKFADALSNLEWRQVSMALEPHHSRSQHDVIFGQ